LVEDNFLSEEDFTKLCNGIHDTNFSWYFQEAVAIPNSTKLGHIYFNHLFYDNQPCSNYYELLEPIFKKLDVHSLVKVRGNLYPRSETLIKHELHRDQEFECKSALLMLNTCDGYTYLQEDERKVSSVANRLVHFNSYYLHHSTTTTDANARLTININYF
jgi:hypothetical protein